MVKKYSRVVVVSCVIYKKKNVQVLNHLPTEYPFNNIHSKSGSAFFELISTGSSNFHKTFGAFKCRPSPERHMVTLYFSLKTRKYLFVITNNNILYLDHS